MVSWTKADVVDPGRRPGTAVNFTAKPAALIGAGLTGVVAAIVTAGWGPVGEIVEVNSFDDIDRIFSLEEGDLTAPFVLNALLAGGASKILVYRVVGPVADTGGKATHTLEDSSNDDMVTITAKYPGSYGNKFQVSVENLFAGTFQRISLKDRYGNTLRFWDSTVAKTDTGLVDNIVSIINSDKQNIWIDAVKVAAGSGGFTAFIDTSLTTGDGDEANLVTADYIEAQMVFEQENFEMLYVDSSTSAIRSAMASWVVNQRKSGKKITFITGSALGEGVAAAITNASALSDASAIYVYPGFKRNNLNDDEVVYPGYLAAAQIAGIITGLPLVESPTFQPVLYINDLETRLGNDDIALLLKAGILTLVWDGSRYKIERGINTLVEANFDNHENEYYTKIKTLRILDNVNNSLVNISSRFIGKVPNNDEGRDLVIAACDRYLGDQAAENLIEGNYTIEVDPDNLPSGDRFFLKIGIQPIDSIEFIYFTVMVG